MVVYALLLVVTTLVRAGLRLKSPEIEQSYPLRAVSWTSASDRVPALSARHEVVACPMVRGEEPAVRGYFSHLGLVVLNR